MFKNILIPVDSAHKEMAEKSITAAKGIMQEGDVLTLLSVLPVIPAYVASELPSDFQAGAEDKLLEDLRNFAQQQGMADKTKILVKHGNPYPVILDTAEANDATLIIIASSQPGWESYLLGSVASKVVNHAKCSVLVVR